MFAGSNVGAYASLNMLSEFGPPKVTDTHDGVLKPQVVNAYESNRRVPGPPAAEVCGAIGGAGFCAPQALAVPSRFRRKFCVRVDPATLGNEGGVVPSSVLVIANVVIPIGTENGTMSAPGPPPYPAFSRKSAFAGHPK